MSQQDRRLSVLLIILMVGFALTFIPMMWNSSPIVAIFLAGVVALIVYSVFSTVKR